jgi:hypothetical protein
MITGTDVTVWTISGLLASELAGCPRETETRDKLVRDWRRWHRTAGKSAPASQPETRDGNARAINGTLPDNELTAPGDLALLTRLTAAILPAIAFLVIVHGAVLAGFLAALGLCRKTNTTNRCRKIENKFWYNFHSDNFAQRNDASTKITIAP